MTITLLSVAYLHVALLLFVIWRRQARFPDALEFLDVIFIGLTVLLWPMTFCVLACVLHAKRKSE